MKFKFLFFALFITIISFGQTTGTISGILKDKNANNQPLAFANIILKNTTISANSDIDGKYIIKVAPGEYTIVFSFIGYENVEVPVTVVASETVTINKSIGSGNYTLQDVVVKSANINREKETAILLDQKKSIEIKQSIGAQEMSRKGVSNVEQGVAKLSGVSKVADRGLFIRGLDDRYNYLQINGLNFIPSDPNLKTIPLNFIPSDIVRNIDVYKTFKSTLYQDFAGASINVITKDVSNKPYTKISISAGGNSLTTFKKTKAYPKSNNEFIGYADKDRKAPSFFSENVAYTASPSESLNSFKTGFNPTIDNAPFTFGTGISNSDSFNLSDGKKIGYFINFNFNNNFNNQFGKRRNLNSSGSAVKDFDLSRWSYLSQKSALLTLNFRKNNKYNFGINAVYIQNSENTIEEIVGENTDYVTIDKPFFLRDSKFIENTAFGLQQIGTFNILEKKLILDYGVGISSGKNDTPNRTILATEGQGKNSTYLRSADPFRFFFDLKNTNVNTKFDLEYNFGSEINSKPRNTLRVGHNFDITNYNLFNKIVRTINAPTGVFIDTDNPDAFFNNSFANNSSLQYDSQFSGSTVTTINQVINAVYLNYTKNFEKLTLDFGLRFETLLRTTKYNEETDRIDDFKRKIKYNPSDYSPVINVKYLLNEKTNIRFTSSRTSTKPRIREILPFRYSDGDGNFTQGNPNLINTTNYNVDLKYEIFPDKNSLFAVGLFGKLIQNPISRLAEGTSTGFLTKFENFDEAKLFGIELETNFGLDLIFKESAIAKRISFGLNTIYMKSEETGDPEKFPRLTTTKRSLQGASDFIINTDIGFELAKNDKIESKASIVFNTFSDRIYAIGTDGASDIIQKAINQLDFTWRNTFNKKYQLNLTLKNLLNENFLAVQNPTKEIADPVRFSNVNNLLSQGINFGLEFSYSFN